VGGFFKSFLFEKLNGEIRIPPTEVGGLFKSCLRASVNRKDLNYPPTAVGGIKNDLRKVVIERT
jgi:hypothetical protein